MVSETPQSKKYSLQEVYKNFGDRRPLEIPYPKELPFPNISANKELFSNAAAAIALAYEKIQPGGTGNKHEEFPTSHIEYQTLYTTQLSAHPPISIMITKEFITTAADITEARIKFNIFEMTDPRAIVGELHALQNSKNEWDMRHRFVAEEYRGRGVMSLLLTAFESFVAQYAKEKQVSQNASINAGQPSVLVAFLNKGYQPKNPKDKENLEMILRGDEKLELDYSVRRNEEPGGNEWIVQHDKDLYAFCKKTDLRIEPNAVRVNLVRNFAADIEVHDIKKRVADVIKGV